MTKSAERPYPGSRPFLRTDSRLFFGRLAEAAALAEMWRASRLTIVWGPSASGKTSLLQSGLLPLVGRWRSEVLPPGRISYGATFPVAALPEHDPFTLALLRSWAPRESPARLVGLTIRDYLNQRAERHDGTILAAIDQAEELLAYSGPREAYRSRFVSDLAEAMADEPRVHLLLVMRQTARDYFAGALGGGPQFEVAPLSFESALCAVTGPAKDAGRSFGPGAAETLVRDLLTSRIGTPEGSKPGGAEQVQPALLQVVCSKLWDCLPATLNEISRGDVQRYGEADSILAGHCSRVIAAVAGEHEMSVSRLRSWLSRTFITEHCTLATAYEGVTHTAGMPNGVVRALEDRHLLRAEWRSSARWYELLSDRLVAPLRNSSERLPPPVTPAGNLRAAERALALGDLVLAEHLAEETLRTAPAEDLRLRANTESLLGNFAYEQGKPAEAERHYRAAAMLFEAARDNQSVARALAAVGRTLLAQDPLADAEREQERLATVVKELQSAADRLPYDSMVQTELGWALWHLGQSQAAVAIFSGVLALDGANADALRGRGEILANLGEAREALRDLDRVTSRDQPSARAARGLALAKLGEHERAEEEIQAALKEAPRNGPVLLYAARADELVGARGDAVALAERAIDAADPPLPGHMLEVARRLVSGGGSPHVTAGARR
jgi:tetratricopeptide (TPR) repeat protein